MLEYTVILTHTTVAIVFFKLCSNDIFFNIFFFPTDLDVFKYPSMMDGGVRVRVSVGSMVGLESG